MTLNRTAVRKLLYRLGFPQAPKWDDETLRVKALEIPKRYSLDQIPKRYRELYEKLGKFARTNEFIVWESTTKENHE